MANDKKYNTQKHTKNFFTPARFFRKEIERIIEEKIKESTKAADTEKPIQQATPELNQPKEKERWTISNWFEFCAIAVNIILVFFTYMLWKQTATSIELTEKALNEAKRANDITIQNSKSSDSISAINLALMKKSVDAAVSLSNTSDSNYNISKKSLESSIEGNNKMFNVQSKSVDAQISAINSNKGQFLATNEPYVEASHFVVGLNEKTNEINMLFELDNLGNQPIKFDEQKSKFVFTMVGLENVDMSTDGYNSMVFNVYLGSKATGKYQIPVGGEKPTEYWIKKLKDNDADVHFYSEMRYQNLITKKKKVYKIYVIIMLKSSTYRIVTTENKDLSL